MDLVVFKFLLSSVIMFIVVKCKNEACIKCSPFVVQDCLPIQLCLTPATSCPAILQTGCQSH